VREQGLAVDQDAEVAAIEARELELIAGTEAIGGAVAFAAAVPPARFAVVTSGSRAIASARLAAVGVPLPRVFVTADDVTAGKPDPEAYLLAARGLGVRADAVPGARGLPGRDRRGPGGGRHRGRCRDDACRQRPRGGGRRGG
jgi:mannitol-1-/sugar-/sorbitol-6-phosphatase